MSNGHINELSDHDLSRWIAGRFEFIISSNITCWRWNGEHWETRDMIHDSAMTLMLLEKLSKDWEVLLSKNEDVWYLQLLPHSKNVVAVAPIEFVAYRTIHSVATSHNDVQRVIAQGFALAKGWTEAE
jgi:hypothetical protein